MLPSEPFRFEKWYMDAADARGDALIAYRASLAWGALRFGWQGVAHYPATGAPPRRSSIRLGDPPAIRDGTLTWEPASLGFRLAMGATQPPIHARLWEDCPNAARAPLVVDWRCVAPRANVEAALPSGAPLAGVGYAECLTMTLPPWKLPLRELRWGRWCGDDGGSLIWIEWRGDAPRRWCWLDGVAVQATVHDLAVTGGGFALTLTGSRTLEERAFTRVAREVPGLLPLLPQSLRRMQESKWLSLGSMQRDGEPHTTGRAIHEVVVLG